MLTAEDLLAHDRLIAALPTMSLEEVVEVYRRARRTYEAQHWAGEDSDHAEVRSEILGRELADRVAFGTNGLAASKAGKGGVVTDLIPTRGGPPAHGKPLLPDLVGAAGPRAEIRFLEFFAATIRNAHTRRAYSRAVIDFLIWCEGRGVTSIVGVQPLHVAALH